MENDFNLNSEVKIHGTRWNTFHDGYFSDLNIALPFLETISREIRSAKPSVVADLGGGTGFILSEISKRHPQAGLRFINVDISPKQLCECDDKNISSLQMSITEVERNSLIKDNGSLMLIIRSVLHYMGYEGVIPFLKHLRNQLNPGEILIHQTACFETIKEADCINRLYSLMRTPKWYPTIASLCQTLKETGWDVLSYSPAPDLLLKSADLAERYSLKEENIFQICSELGNNYDLPAIFKTDGRKFGAYLKYSIFTCQAR